MSLSNYCQYLGFARSSTGSAGHKKLFLKVNLPHDFTINKEHAGEFSEGKIIERSHKMRERISIVIMIAKESFKKKHGKLFCEVCKTDFEKKYGEIGKDFIEGYHTVAVNDNPPGYKTKPEEIAML